MKHFSTGGRILAAVTLLASLALSPTAQAQVLYGSVVGTLEDASGAAIPNVNLVLTNTATGKIYEDKTDGTGRYAIGNVIPGTYDLKASATGFKALSRTGLNVTANTVTRQDLTMQVGSLTEEVTVSADATQLQTDKSDTHTELSAKQVASLPLPGYRNYQSLINLVPGATPAAFQNSATDSPGRSLRTNINGTNANNNTTRIDGAASVNLWLPHHAGYVMPAEMVDVVNVTTTAPDAEQGMAGGAAVTVLTKSGTNEFKGSAFWFHDNQHLKARNFFQPVGVEQPLSIYNNYGGTIGGPIVKNKLFFFYSFDGTKQRTGATAFYSVPTADIRTGNFSAYPTAIFDPATGDQTTGQGRTQFAGNIIPASRISAQGARLMSYFPLPTREGAQNNFFAAATPKFDRDYNDLKINYNRTTNHSMYFRWGRMDALVGGVGAFGDAIGGAPGSDPGLGDTKVKNMSLGHTWTLSPSIILDGVIGYQRQDQVVRGNDFGKDFSTVLGIPGIGGSDPREQGFPNISVSGYTGFGVPGWMPLERIEQNYTMSHNLSVIKGAHEMRFGFDGTNYRMNHWQPELGAGPRGAINFTGGTTSAGVFNLYNAAGALLLGLPNQMQKSIQYILMTPREYQFGIYARDRWQVNKKLTVNLGLRWEYYPLMTRAGGKGIERLDAETNQVFLGGRGNIPVDNGITVSKRLFAPRVGIAYRMNDKTVLRTGYGISYDPLPFSRPLRGFYPLTVNFNFVAPNELLPVRTLAQGIPAVSGPDISSGVVNLPNVADMRTPYKGQINRGYTQSWNFTLERNLPQNIVGTLAYVGTQSTNLLADLDINAATSIGSGAAGRPYFSRFNRSIATNLWDGYLSSNYHSLQSSLRKSFSKGLMLQGAYTYSKAINMTDEDGWASVTWNYLPAFGRNRAAAGYDRRHVFQMGWLYDLPMGKGHAFASSGVLSHILGGWSVSGIASAYTGTPFTPSAPAGTLNTPGIATQTPDQINPNVTRIGDVGPGTRFYDITAFQAPVVAPGTFRMGSMGRNSLRNPGRVTTDLSLARTFKMGERFTTMFRAEAYNFTNTGQFTGFASANVADPNFLRVLSATGERQVRFGLRLGF
ncbi:hypothetical protein F183_A26680 [Bryobacterales bacterium F-183]|nr:hypothetical protein F183_A26680 [Bryobacterales bacterium F-183]